MDNLNPTEVLKFLNFVNDLKHLPRRGWIFSKIKDHETISGMYGILSNTWHNRARSEKFSYFLVCALTPLLNNTFSQKIISNACMKKCNIVPGNILLVLFFRSHVCYGSDDFPARK